MGYDDDPDAVVSLTAWRNSKRPKTTCKHERTLIDQIAGTVECRECGEVLSPFHVLLRMAQGERALFDRVRSLQAKADELARYSPHLKTMKELERIWRGRRMIPICPHCGTGIWPQELLAGGSRGVRYEITLRQKAGKLLPNGVDEKMGVEAIA